MWKFSTYTILFPGAILSLLSADAISNCQSVAFALGRSKGVLRGAVGRWPSAGKRGEEVRDSGVGPDFRR